MKEKDALALVAAYEKLALDVARRIAERKSLPKTLPADKMLKLETAMGSPDKVNAFLKSMPSKPDAEAVLDAFAASPEKLGKLLDGPLGGDMKLLAALAAGGCNRDPTNLVALADKFNGDPAAVKSLLDDCGLKSHPDAFAALLQDGCGGNPDKLLALSNTFKKKEDQEHLAAALGAGGLGAAPAALAALAADGDGANLRKLTNSFKSDDDHKKLNSLLTEGGLDGRGPGRPGLLKDVLVTGLGNDPAVLKNIHSAYKADPPPPNDMDQLARMCTALDGKDESGGKNLKKVMARVPPRLSTLPPPPPTPAESLKHFSSTIESMGRAAGAPDVTGGGVEKARDAAVSRADPPATQMAGTLTGALDAGSAGQALADMLGDPDERAAAASATQSAQAFAARSEALEKADAPDEEDLEQTTRTRQSTKNLTDVAILAKTEGAPLSEITALEKLISEALADAALEHDDPTRTNALKAIKDGTDALKVALKRAAAAKLAAAGPAGGAAAHLANVQEMRNTASQAEKDALAGLSTSAQQAAIVVVGAAGDPVTTATSAEQAVVSEFIEGDRQAERDRRNKAAKDAATLADAVRKQVVAAAIPIDPSILSRANDAASGAVKAGREATDKDDTTLAFTAANLLAEEIAKACKKSAAQSETAAVHASTDGGAAMNSASSCDQAIVALEKQSGGGGADAVTAQAAAEDARASGFAIAEIDRLLDATPQDLQDAAKETARRQAAADKGDTPDGPEITTATQKADKDADDARKAAHEERVDLAALDVAADPNAYQTAINKTRVAGEAALCLGALAVNDATRNDTLTAAKEALKEVTKACNALSKHFLKAAGTQLTADQTTASNTANVSVAAVRGNADAANVKAASDDIRGARDAINASAQAVLSDLVLNDPDVTTLRDAAVKAEAEANVPGANRLAEVKSLIAKSKANRKIAEKVGAKFHTAVGAIPPRPPNAPAPPPNVLGPWPNPAADVSIRAAMAACEAKATAGAKWMESAKAVVEAIRVFDAEFNAMKPLSPDEVTAHDDIKHEKANAETQETDALAFQLAHKNSRGTDIRKMFNLARSWTKWTRKKDANDDRSQRMGDANGFVKALATEGLRTSQGSSFTPQSRDDLMRIAATLEDDHYTGANVEEVTLASGDKADVAMLHVCGRHVRESYGYGEADGGPMPDDQIVGRMLEGKYEGNMIGVIGPDADENQLIRQGKLDKPNSLLPEGVNKGNLQAIATEVMSLVEAIGMAPPHNHANLLNYVNADPNTWLQGSVDISATITSKVTYGIGIDGGKAKLRMLYATDGDSLMMPDMVNMGKALGL